MSTAYDIFYTVYNRKLYEYNQTHICNGNCKNKFAGTKNQAFVVFSIYTNGKQLFACKNAAPSSGIIQCLDGLRVLSIMWIVYCHSVRCYVKIPLHESTTYEKVWFKQTLFNRESIEFKYCFLFQYLKTYRSTISNAPMPVDTFFVMSGLLVANKLFKLLKKWDETRLRWHEIFSPYGSFLLFFKKINSHISEMENWMFYHCIGIDIYVLHPFWVYVF